MSNRRYSPGLGRWIEVEEVDVPGVPAKARRRRQEEPFAMVPLRFAQEMAKASKSPATIICIRLFYLSWKAKSPTVALSNRDGIYRNSKARVLRDLEAAGLVRVKRRSGQSPQVTILRQLPWCRPAPT
jgi:hypothetical protein